MCLIAALGVGVWGGLRVERDGTESAAAAGRSVASPSTGGQVGSGSVISALADPVVLPDGRPSDFSAEDWAALKEALAKKEAKLKSEQALSKWTYTVSKWTLDALLKNRGDLLPDKKAPEGAPGAANPALPAIPGLNLPGN